MIIELIDYACNYSASTSASEDRSFEHTISTCISKPHLVQAGLSVRVANRTHAWTHMNKNGGYHYFNHLYPVIISNSISVSEYWHKYPQLKLSSTYVM